MMLVFGMQGWEMLNVTTGMCSRNELTSKTLARLKNYAFVEKLRF